MSPHPAAAAPVSSSRVRDRRPRLASPHRVSSGGAFLVAFFLTELGDTSSLATAALVTGHGLLAVGLGATLGLLAATALALVGGIWLQQRVSTCTLRLVGAAFLVAGVITLAPSVW